MISEVVLSFCANYFVSQALMRSAQVLVLDTQAACMLALA